MACSVSRAESDNAQNVEIVVTGSRSPESVQTSTVHTGMVTRQEAERRGAVSVAEALEGEPGLQVNPNAYDTLGSPAGVMMQGLDAGRVLILRDGERHIGDSGGVIDLDQFDIGDIQRIEYVLGPSSSLYGTGALGGVINVVTAGPDAEGLTLRSRLQARSVPEYLVGTVGAYRAGPYWTVATASRRQSAAVRADEARPDTSLAARERTELGLRVGSDESEAATVAEVNWARNGSTGLQTQSFPGLGDYLVDLPDDNDRLRLRIRQNYELTRKAELRVSASGQIFSGESAKDRRGSAIDEHRTRRQRLLSTETTATFAGAAHTFICGLRLEQEDFEQSLQKAEATEAGIQLSSAAEVDPTTLRNLALYGQLGWDVTEQLTILPGVRGELHQRFGYVLAPRLAAAFRPHPDWQWRLALGRGFRAPSAKEFGFQFDHSFLGYRVLGNPRLEPERSWGVSGDVVFRADRYTRLRVGAFHNWVSSLISTDFVGQSAPGVDDFSYVNVGRARTLGADAEVTWQIGSQLRSQVAYSYLFTRDDDAGLPLPSRPAHTVLSALSYSPIEDLSFTLRNRLVSSAFVTPKVATPGFIKLDFRVSKGVLDYLEVYCGFLNGLDLRDDPGRPGDQRPVLGRVYYVGLNDNYEEGL